MTATAKQFGVYKGITNGYISAGDADFTITYPNFLGSDNCTVGFTSLDAGDAMILTYKNTLHVLGGASTMHGRATWESDMFYHSTGGYTFDATYNLQKNGFITSLTGSKNSTSGYPQYDVVLSSSASQHYWVCYTELFITAVTLT